ncbi:hypothetical protein FDENT_3649 [Fusarium denticulatum]|uniref:Ricin B lectin domain-containing protein n=1 Tax=Fusarium denticulatum TaxID=48507 RepID=A0A8H5XCD9_9HYPO|nr:hypothetical protein FDENT_3649 [Fusarium denticulatum]
MNSSSGYIIWSKGHQKNAQASKHDLSDPAAHWVLEGMKRDSPYMNKVVKIRNVKDGTYLDVKNSHAAEDTAIITHNGNSGSGQKFEIYLTWHLKLIRDLYNNSIFWAIHNLKFEINNLQRRWLGHEVESAQTQSSSTSPERRKTTAREMEYDIDGPQLFVKKGEDVSVFDFWIGNYSSTAIYKMRVKNALQIEPPTTTLNQLR